MGFSIAQIMGFMGSGGVGGTKSQSENEEKTKEEQKRSQPHFEMASNGTNAVVAEQPQPLPLMPKLWRPQPFRDYGISHSSQPK